jgi:hypothetical protein
MDRTQRHVILKWKTKIILSDDAPEGTSFLESIKVGISYVKLAADEI